MHCWSFPEHGKAPFVAKGGDFNTGALSGAAAEGLTAIATENLGKYLDSRFATEDDFKVATAQVIGIMAAAAGNGDPDIAGWVSGNAERYNAQVHREAAARLNAGFVELHAKGEFLDIKPEDVMKDLQKIVDGEKNPNNLNPSVVKFLNTFPPAMLRDLFFEPTQKERLAMLGIEVSFPSIAGKGRVLSKIGEKVFKDISEALEKRFAKEALEDVVKLNQKQQSAVTKINNSLKNFKGHDIVGTLKDMAGTPVARKDGTGYFNHLKEMQDRIQGFTKHSETLKKINNPEAQAARQAALDALKRISDALSGAGI